MLVVIPLMDLQGRRLGDSQDHLVPQDLQDSLAMWAHLGLQGEKVRRALEDQWAPPA